MSEPPSGDRGVRDRRVRARTTGRTPPRSTSQLELDARLRQVGDVARGLPALTARGTGASRNELVAGLEAGRHLNPRLDLQPVQVPRHAWTALAEARRLATDVAETQLHLDRLDELELELQLMECLGNGRQVRSIARRRYPTGATTMTLGGGDVRLAEVAGALLDELQPQTEERTLGASDVAEVVQTIARGAGLDVEIRIEPGLVANAAAGERTVFLADRRFGPREAHRLAVHEVLGHLTAAANARAQPLAVVQVGTAGAFADQEGVAIQLEAESDLLDDSRVRTFAARVWCTDRVHEDVAFEDVARLLVGEYGFRPEAAIALALRSYRGGGLTRDASYLCGWLGVRTAVRSDPAGPMQALHRLRLGRVSVRALPALQRLLDSNALRSPTYCPAVPVSSFAFSPPATASGTSASTPPPSFPASLPVF